MAFVDLNDSVIAQVRSAADIVDFVSQVTPLKLAGKSYKGLCPFHREKTPSFHVDRGKGLFYCFGCGAGGDVFKFLAMTERFTFPEAVEHVATRVGIELPRRRKTTKENDKDDLFEVVDEASEAFHQALGWGDNSAKKYLDERAVTEAIIKKYGFGYAPDFAGVPGVVASMGTSLTTGQASLLRRYTTRVVIAYDGDDAGRHATLRAAPILLSAGLTVSALDLQGEKDPDSLVQKFGVDRFLELLGNATDIFKFALKEWAVDVGALTGREKSERIDAFVPLLSAVTDGVVRND